MPRVRTILGRQIPRLTTKRLVFLLAALSFAAFTCILGLTSSIPSPPTLSSYDRKVPIPHIPDSLSESRLNPFRQPSHPPPRQKNDNFAGASWWADWKWLSVPFSSTLTLDDDRALLPPLKERAPIYCYYDATIKKSRDEKDAESALLLTWRRAWWAHGFRPVILSASEATNNPLYQEMHRLAMSEELKADMMRWLAWNAMDGGLLAHYTMLPMGRPADPLLEFLRRDEFPRLLRWKDLESGLLAGPKSEIDTALRSLLDDPSVMKDKKDLISSLPKESFQLDETMGPLAYYSATVIKKRYPKVAESAAKSRTEGLVTLNILINSHLHGTWQSHFPKGIEVLKPFPEHTTTLISGGVQLAQFLAACAETPLPASCPPNMPKCTPCVSRTPLEVSTPGRYHNDTKIFAIGTVPHPWTTALVANMKESIDIGWIRFESERDPWLDAVTQSLLGTGVSGAPRIVHFKEVVAGPFATAYSLWVTAEKEIPKNIDWYFGFAIPQHAMDKGKAASPVPADRLPNKKEEAVVGNGPVATEDDLKAEGPMLDRAKAVVAQTKSTPETKMRASLEAWNLADTEAWKFVKAFQARRTMEREEWEKEESKYSAGAGSEGGRSAWNRWQDKKDDEET